jgi:hypothetical protein
VLKKKKTMKKCLRAKSVTASSRNRIQNVHTVVQFSKRKRKKNPNRLEKGLPDLLAPDHPAQRKLVEVHRDLLAPDLLGPRRQVEDLQDLLALDLPGLRKQVEDRLALPAPGPQDQRKQAEGLRDHRKEDHPRADRQDRRKEGLRDHRKEDRLDRRNQDHLAEVRQREGLLDQRKVDLLGQKRVDHLDLSVAHQSDEAFKCLNPPMILGIFIFQENYAHPKLLQSQ